MISVGSNIQSGSDELQKVTLGYVADRIMKPQEHIESQIRRLSPSHESYRAKHQY